MRSSTGTYREGCNSSDCALFRSLKIWSGFFPLRTMTYLKGTDKQNRDRQTERDRETERETDRERDRQRARQNRQTYRQSRQREGERERDRQTEQTDRTTHTTELFEQKKRGE